MGYFLSFYDQNPQVQLEQSVAPHPVSLSSVLISHPTADANFLIVGIGFVKTFLFSAKYVQPSLY